MERCTLLVLLREDSPDLGAPQKLMHSVTTFRSTGETVTGQHVRVDPVTPTRGRGGHMVVVMVAMVAGVEVVAGATMGEDTMVVGVMVESPLEVVSSGEENKDDAAAHCPMFDYLKSVFSSIFHIDKDLIYVVIKLNGINCPEMGYYAQAW